MKKNFLFSALALIFLWLVWLIVYSVVKNDYILPSFWETLEECGRLVTVAAFWRAFKNTLLRTLWAFLLSFGLGIGLALIASLQRFLRAFFAPIISTLRTVPTMAIILMLLIWTNPRIAPVLVSLLVLFPAFYSTALSAMDEVRGEYGILARVFQVSSLRKIFLMYLPLSAPAVLRQAGAIVSMGLKITISGEVLANTFQSLGGLMQEAKIFVEMPLLLALTLVSILLGFLLEGAGFCAYKLLVRWKK